MTSQHSDQHQARPGRLGALVEAEVVEEVDA